MLVENGIITLPMQKNFAGSDRSVSTMQANSMELSGKRTSRPTINAIKSAVRPIIDEVPELREIFGFGSYFRSPDADDCDVLLVIRDDVD